MNQGSRPLRVGGLGVHHGHITTLLEWALARPDAELVGVCHDRRERLDAICDPLGIDAGLRFTDFDHWWTTAPDLVLISSSIDEHPLWLERISAAGGAHVVVEKPFAMSAGAALGMARAVRRSGHQLAVNWPLSYDPATRTLVRLVREGAIGEIRELHWYGGNAGPFHWLDPADPRPDDAWMYDAARGGGAFEDYIGYATNVTSWLLDAELPTSVIAIGHTPAGLPIDTQTSVIAEYGWGLATFHTRWSLNSNPWIERPFPHTGITVVGSRGAVAGQDYGDSVALYGRTASDLTVVPVDTGAAGSAMDELASALALGRQVEGPASPAISYAGQLVNDAARDSVRSGTRIDLRVTTLEEALRD